MVLLIGKPCIWDGNYGSIPFYYGDFSEGDRTLMGYSIFCYNLNKPNISINILEPVSEEDLEPLDPESQNARAITSNILLLVGRELESLRDKSLSLEEMTENEKPLQF